MRLPDDDLAPIASFDLCNFLPPEVTTRAAEFASEACMYGYESIASEQYGHQYRHEDISWEQFEQRFREAYGREMTPHEHHWFHSIWTVVYGGEQERSNGAAA